MKRYFLFLLLLLQPVLISAQDSKLIETGIIKSTILKEVVKFSIYLPAGYETSSRSYPVLYLLHGLGDDHTGWPQFGDAKEIADRQISGGDAVPMIIVMPDAKRTFYMNNYDGSYKYEDFFINELIPFIEKNYRVRVNKEFRALAGLSMGGYGSLLYSMHHPDMFSACYAMSAAVRTDEEMTSMDDNSYNYVYRDLTGNYTGKDRLTKHYNENSILNLVANMPQDQKNKIRFYIDCGDDDFLYKGNSALHVLMRDMNVPHEYRVRQGGHEWEYWRTGLAEALKVISKGFHR